MPTASQSRQAGNHPTMTKNENRFDIRASLNIEATAGDDGKPTRFNIMAYDGGLLPVWWDYPVVIDLAGLDVSNQKIPILKEHSSSISAVAGQTDSVRVEGSAIIESGELFAAEDIEVSQMVAKAKKGYQWQCSIGARVDRREFIAEGVKITVNNQEFTGPLYVARSAKLVETSLVTFGACENTIVEIEAQKKERDQMPNDNKAPEAMEPQTINAGETQKPDAAKKDIAPIEPQGVVADIRAQASAEISRVAAVKNAAGDNAEIAAKAVAEGWSAEKTELEALRAKNAQLQAMRDGRPAAPAAHIHSGEPVTGIVLEAASRLNSSEARAMVEKDYDEKTLEAASRFRSVSIRGMIEAACRLDGVAVPAISASPDEWVRAAFSTSTFTGILSNSANKSMVASYLAFPDIEVVRKIAKKLSANDFKAHTGYRLGASTIFDAVSDGGEIKHGALSDAAYPYAVDTYGKMMGITRKMMINDDLNAFAEIPILLGRGAAQKLSALFWAMFAGNANSFFSSGHKNLDNTHANVDVDGYKAAEALLLGQVDDNGIPISVTGKYIVTPVALSAAARTMYVSTNLLPAGLSSTSAKKMEPSQNIYANMFEPLRTPYLTDTGYWYLLADPQDCPAFGVAYLKGQETPVIEEVTISGDYLGKAWRGYIDMGVCQIDYRGAVKMA